MEITPPPMTTAGGAAARADPASQDKTRARRRGRCVLRHAGLAGKPWAVNTFSCAPVYCVSAYSHKTNRGSVTLRSMATRRTRWRCASTRSGSSTSSSRATHTTVRRRTLRFPWATVHSPAGRSALLGTGSGAICRETALSPVARRTARSRRRSSGRWTPSRSSGGR